jgi:hypothetical protein
MAYTPEQFAAILMQVAAETPRETVKVVRKGSGNVKTDSRRNVQITAPIHNAHAFRAITYDIEAVGVTVVGVIGYDKDINGGPLGNLLEFGGGGDHSPPHRDLGRALDVEEPRFADALGDMGERLLS